MAYQGICPASYHNILLSIRDACLLKRPAADVGGWYIHYIFCTLVSRKSVLYNLIELFNIRKFLMNYH